MSTTLMGGAPFRVVSACLGGDRLLCQFVAEDAGLRVTVARMKWDGGEGLMREYGPWLLEGEVPARGGRLTLLVEAVSGDLSDAPPLSFAVGLYLQPQAARDYQAAEPCGARLEWDCGRQFRVDRVLRQGWATVLFWSWHTGGTPGIVTGGHLRSDLLAADQLLHATSSFYDYVPGQQAAPEAGQPGGPMLPVAVPALCFAPAPAGASLTLRLHGGEVHEGGPWQLGLTIPGGRPCAVAVDQPVAPSQQGGVRLSEAWLSRAHTTMLFTAEDGEHVPTLHRLSLSDQQGRIYPPTSASSRDGWCEAQFAPVPEGVEELTLSGEGLPHQVPGLCELPIEPGAVGRTAATAHGWRQPSFPGSFGNRAVLHAQVELPTRPVDEPIGPAPDRELLRKWLKDQVRPAQRLTFQPAPAESLDPYGSHLGGAPFRPMGEPWPSCGFCGKPLWFIGQVRLDKLAERSGDAQLLVFYYCLECAPWGPDQEDGYRLRLYRDVEFTPRESSPPPVTDRPDQNYYLPPVPSQITLQEVLSAPHLDDVESELVGFDLGSRRWEVYDDEAKALTGAPSMESRIGGYPEWIQGPHWPECPACGQRMTFLWQLDSEEGTGLMWGDTGRVYLFACPRACGEKGLALILQCC